LFGEPEAKAKAIASRLGDARLLARAKLRFESANRRFIEACRHPGQEPELAATLRLWDRFAFEKSPSTMTARWN
jgi:hypothetical protein